MKKLTSAFTIMTMLMLGVFSITSAGAIGINVGVSGQLGAFTGSANETQDLQAPQGEEATAAVGYTSVFIEKTLGSRLIVGYDYVPESLSSDVQSRALIDNGAFVTNKVSVDFEDLSTTYVALKLTKNIYVKAGMLDVDVVTNETLGSGSAYGNTSLDGTVYAVGYNHTRDNGLFIRGEFSHMEFDGVTLTSTVACVQAVNQPTCKDNTVKLNNLDGLSGKLSIGKSF
jgi:hypothetical protein